MVYSKRTCGAAPAAAATDITNATKKPRIAGLCHCWEARPSQSAGSGQGESARPTPAAMGADYGGPMNLYRRSSKPKQQAEPGRPRRRPAQGDEGTNAVQNRP